MDVNRRILSQAAEMFRCSGIRAVTMDDIARETGVSKRTIYECFRDKDDLLMACMHYMDEIHNRETEKIISASQNTIDMFFNLLRHGVDMLKMVNPLFFKDLKRYHFTVWRKTYRINAEKHLSQTFTLLKQGIEEGLIRRDIDVEVTSILLHEQLKIMSDESIFPSNKYSIIVVFENIIINFIRGIATSEGLRMIESENLEDE